MQSTWLNFLNLFYYCTLIPSTSKTILNIHFSLWQINDLKENSINLSVRKKVHLNSFAVKISSSLSFLENKLLRSVLQLLHTDTHVPVWSRNKRWMVQSTGKITLQWISIRSTSCTIHWIKVYSVNMLQVKILHSG